MVGTRGATSGRRIGVARLHRRGTAVQRVLVVGDGSFVNEPDDPAQRRFTEQLADRIAARTRRGLDLDVVWDLAPVLHAVTGATEAWRLWRYEAVVVLVHEPHAGRTGRWRSARVGKLARQVIPALAEASRVLVVRLRSGPDEPGPEPWGGLDRSIVSSVVVQLGHDGLLEPGATRADPIADLVSALLHRAAERASLGAGRTASERRARPDPEAERQHAVDRMSERLGGVTPHLERVVLLARNTFDVPFAQVNLLDHGRVRTLAFVGAPGDTAEQPICTISVRSAGPTIIADTWNDHRLDTNPHVHGGDHPVRFYAAHPIESMDGYRVGTLCVFDLKPHDPRDVDPSVLRDLALLAEAEISALPED
ncbi:MAG: GAF domain-containing protein [Acidobacteria bacterium]|nr:GAF domain-containing protein [Acidobacteriota bacterium]